MVEKDLILEGLRDEKMRSWENIPKFKVQPSRDRFAIPDKTNSRDERSIFLSYMEGAVNGSVLDRKGAMINPSFVGIMLVMYFTGARVSEISRCTIDEIDFEKNTITKFHHKTAKKTGKIKTIYLPGIAMQVTNWCMENSCRAKGNSYLFPGKGGHGCYTWYARQWNLLRERTGIKVSPPLGMRREYARVGRELDGGRDVTRVQKILSYSNKGMTEVYAGDDEVSNNVKNLEVSQDAQRMQSHLMKKIIVINKKEGD